MRIPINMGVKGKVTATLTNVETGEKQEVKGDNLILNHYLDWAMTQGLGILGNTTFNRCYIGTSDVPPQPTDTTFVGTQLAMSAESKLVKGINLVKYVEPLYIDDNIVVGVGKDKQMVVTPDDMFLLVGHSSLPDYSGISVYEINSVDWKLTPIETTAFDDIKDFGCRALSFGGDILFVGLDRSPWGKIYKYEEGNFTFLTDLGNINTPPVSNSAISPDGRYLAVKNSDTSSNNTPKTFVYKIESGSLSAIGSISTKFVSFLTFSLDNKLAIGQRYDGVGIYRVDDMEIQLEFETNFSNPRYCHDGIFDSRGNLFITATNESSASNNPAIHRIYWDGVNFNQQNSIFLGVSMSRYDQYRLSMFDDNIYMNYGRFMLININYLRFRFVDSINPDIYLGEAASGVLIKSGGVFMTVTKDGLLGAYKIQSDFIPTVSYARQWTFPAGVGTGIVNRIGLQANSSSVPGGNNRHVAQIVLPEPLEKTDLHQLDVIWEIEVENPGVWEGVILGGSRDGSDLAWRVTINEEQFLALVPTGYNILANWFGVTGTPNVRIGMSNEESDLIFDRENIRGKQIQYISSSAISIVNSYVPGSLKRTIRLFLEVDQGNGQIGEIVLGGSQSVNSLARITFDPPLDKPPHEGEGANPYRLYLDLEIGWQRGE